MYRSVLFLCSNFRIWSGNRSSAWTDHDSGTGESRISGSIFLLEMGPGWTVHLNPDGYVEGRMEETMEPAAINRTRFTADLVLETTVNVILNGRAALTQVEVRVPLASFLLDGDVPAYYGS